MNINESAFNMRKIILLPGQRLTVTQATCAVGLRTSFIYFAAYSVKDEPMCSVFTLSFPLVSWLLIIVLLIVRVNFSKWSTRLSHARRLCASVLNFYISVPHVNIIVVRHLLWLRYKQEQLLLSGNNHRRASVVWRLLGGRSCETRGAHQQMPATRLLQLSEMSTDADDRLLMRLMSNSDHVLHPLLPDRPDVSYDLRRRAYGNKRLICKTTDMNTDDFIIRALYKDAY